MYILVDFSERATWRLVRLVIAECEAEARADAANSFCSFSQAAAIA